MRVSRSLTIKQMATVSAVSMVFIFIFCVILLFHFLQQYRYNTATQLESIARSVREPLSAAILKADIPEAEAIIKQIKPAGVVSRADVVLPNQFQALRMRFIPERPVPVTITRLFELPIQISLPIYSLERPANPQPLAYLVLQADSYRAYKFVMSTVSTLVTAYLLLTLMMTVAITWCINRLVIHPLRNITRELNDLPAQSLSGHQLALPNHHHDDEIGILARSYNRNQQMLLRQYEDLTVQSIRFPVTELPNKAFLMALLEQSVARQKTLALLLVSCETLRDTSGVLQETQREMLLLTLVEKLRSLLSPRWVLTQISHNEFAIIAHGVNAPWRALELGKQVLTVINERVPLQGIQLRPTACIGVAMFYGDLSAEQLYRRAMSAALSAQRKGKNQLQFFDPEQMELAQQRLSRENAILALLEQRLFALWLQPQVDLASGELTGAQASLRLQHANGDWISPAALMADLDSSSLMAAVSDCVLEECCRVLAAWQSRDIMLPLSVTLPASLVQSGNVPDIPELLRRYRIAPPTLVVTLSESGRIATSSEAERLLCPLHDSGVYIVLDDLAVGYSALRRMQQTHGLPVDALRIDKMFVEDLPQANPLLAPMIHMANALGLELIAQGVEREEQRIWLADAGVQVGEGALFGNAEPANTFEARYFFASDNTEI